MCFIIRSYHWQLHVECYILLSVAWYSSVCKKSVPVSVQELFFWQMRFGTRSYKTISRKIIKYYPYKKENRSLIWKIWNKFQSLAVAKKLLALSLVMSIVPICCILVLNYQLSGSVVRTQTGELIQANLEQNASNIENFYKGYEKLYREFIRMNFIHRGWNQSTVGIIPNDIRRNMKSGNVYRNCAIIIREFLESLFWNTLWYLLLWYSYAVRAKQLLFWFKQDQKQ